MKRLKDFLLRHEYLIIILCLSALLRIPSLLEPYWYGDEGIYLTLGNGIRNGLQLYKDIHDNKPPLLYIVAAISGSVFWFRFLLLLWNSCSLILFDRLAKGILNSSKRPKSFTLASVEFYVPQRSDIATFLFALLPIFAEGNIANGEIFMIMPSLAGALLLWNFYKQKQKNPLSIALAGISFSLAFLFKVPALFDAIAMGIFFFCMLPFFSSTKHSLIERVKSIFTSSYPYIFAVSFLAPILVTVLYYTSIGAGQAYVTGAFAQNVGYLSSWKTGTIQASNLPQSGLKNRAIALGVGTVVLFALAPFVSSEVVLVSIWFGYALFGALLSERPYPHYLIQLIPAGVLLLVLIAKIVQMYKISRTPKRVKRHYALSLLPIGVCVGLFGISLYFISFWYYPVTPYYQNYLRLVLRQQSFTSYLQFFDRRLPELYAIANRIQERTKPEDRIFVWGDLPMLYAITRRLPPGRYTSSYHIKDFNGFAETNDALSTHTPVFIVVDKRYDPPFIKLNALLFDEYLQVYNSDEFVVYKLRSSYNMDPSTL